MGYFFLQAIIDDEVTIRFTAEGIVDNQAKTFYSL